MNNPEIFSTLLAHLSKSPRLLNHCAALFMQQFGINHKEEAINKAVSAYQLAVDGVVAYHQHYGKYVRDASLALLTQYGLSGNIHDVDRAISDLQHAVELAPQGHSRRH